MAESNKDQEEVAPLTVTFTLKGEDAYWTRVLADRAYKSPNQWAKDAVQTHLARLGYSGH